MVSIERGRLPASVMDENRPAVGSCIARQRRSTACGSRRELVAMESSLKARSQSGRRRQLVAGLTTPGGLGTVDAAIVAIIVFGASNADSVAAVVKQRALSYFPQVILGVVMVFYWRRRRPVEFAAPAAPSSV